MVSKTFCTGNADAKIIALIVCMVLAFVLFLLVCFCGYFQLKMNKFVSHQRYYDAIDRESQAENDIAKIVTYFAYLRSRGVDLKPVKSGDAGVGGPLKDILADHRQLVTDPKLDAYRKEVTDMMLEFYGFSAPKSPKAEQRTEKRIPQKV